MSRFAGVGTLAAVALAFCSVVQADEILYTVPLPSGPGVNAANNPTDVAYSPAEQIGAQSIPAGDLLGGDATNPTNAIWSVNSVTLWVEGYTPVTATGTVPFEYSSGLTLYGGIINSAPNVALPNAPLSDLGTVSTGTQTMYSGTGGNPTNYLSQNAATANDYFAVWQVTFTGLDITMGPQADWGFALSSPSQSLALAATACPDNNADNCVSSGVIDFTPNGAQYDLVATYGSAGDVNMELSGTATPEPATFLLFGVGVGVLALVRRRRG